jgi:hypothetical protein
MSLKRRLDKLQEPQLKRWQDEWERFYTPAFEGLERIATCEQADMVYKHLANETAAARMSPKARQPEIDSLRPLWDKLGLYESTWEAWSKKANTNTPYSDGLSELVKWPTAFPMPPDEPEGTMQTLLSWVVEDSVRGWAASISIFWLCQARIVRERKADA